MEVKLRLPSLFPLGCFYKLSMKERRTWRRRFRRRNK